MLVDMGAPVPERPPGSKTPNARRIAKSRALADAGQVSLRVVADAERIERLLATEGLLTPDEHTDYELGTPEERRKARDAWGRGIGKLLELLCALELDSTLRELLRKFRDEMHFTQTS
jgi:hypothetical protein